MSRFIKLDASGQQLPADATDWSAVLDTSSNLAWSAGDVTKKEVTHKKAEEACAKLDLAGATDWRLPTVEELFALADRSRMSPAIEVAFFPSCKSDWYWTSSPCAWSASSAWVVGFYYGLAGNDYRASSASVRAVRSFPSSQ